MQALFFFALTTVGALGLLNISLAVARRRKRRQKQLPARRCTMGPPVAVVIAAYNEERVIRTTLEALRRTRYRNLVQILVVDDGSTDRTADVVREIAASDPRIQLLHQANAEKATALNLGVQKS
jgi:biofilm PGA synthesis N-glycosyltransferase PgaC